jgi:hypothetical protein
MNDLIKRLEAQIEAIKNTNQKHYDDGYAHGLEFAKLERRAKGKRLAKFVMTGEKPVPENEEGQCAEWPRCACGRGGPDLCAGPETASAKESE